MPSYVLKRRKQVLAPNVTVVGSLTIVDNVASGFGSANYLTLPELFRPENNPWERVICFTTGSDVANAQMLNYINYASEQVAGAYIQIYQSRMNMQLSSNGSSWDISSDTGATTTLLPNTNYHAKLRFTGSEYQMLLSTTGEFKGEETLEATIASSTPIYQSNTGADRLGYRVGSQVFTGSIDLSKCYGNINGERWWSGIHYVAENTSYILKRKPYMKYVYNDWQQPVLTANGTMGGDSFAVSTKDVNSSYPAYKAFDGIKSDFGAIFTKTSGYLELYNPRPLKVSSLSVLNFAGDAYGIRSIKAGYIQVSNDGSEYETIKEFTNDVIGGGQSWNISLSDNDTGYKYYRIVATDTSYVNSAASSQAVITELSIIAQEAVSVPATKDDYDFVGDAKSYALNIIKYRDVPNVTVVGSPTIVDNVVSGFSASDYVTMPVSIPTYGYELVFGMQTGSDVTTRQAILGSTANDNSFMLCIRGGEFILIDKIAGVSEGNCIALGGTVTANTTYLVKIVNTGTKVATPTELYYSTDNGATFTLACTIAGQDTPWLNPCPFGVPSSRDSTKEAFTGLIDFTNAYLKSGDEVIWTGSKAEKY